MKKSLIFAGMLAVGYANAQYEGKVGVNTETPKATLEVQPTATNLTGTTNEGLLIPRLSKERVAKMASPETSTLVYVNEATTYTAGTDTAADTRVEKIDAVGFYHYNGTQWVKHLDTDTNDAEWVYDAATNRINLKRGGQNTGFINEVFYDNLTGQYINRDSRQRTIYDTNSNSNVLRDISSIGVKEHLYVSSKALTGNTTKRGRVVDFNIDETQTERISARSQGTSLYISPTNLAPTNWVVASSVDAVKADDLNTSNLFANTNTLSILKGNVTSYSSAVRNETLLNTDLTNISGKSYTMYNVFSLGAKVANMGEFGVEKTFIHILPNTIASVETVSSARYEVQLHQNSGGNIKNLFGVRYDGIQGYIDQSSTSFTNHYGLYIGNVSRATGINRAIHTEAGKIRFGDLANASATADRVVTVDKDGVLKTGEAVTNTVKLATTSAVTCDATTTGTMNFGTVTINNNQTEAFGFCMKNSAGEYKWYYIYGGAGITTGSGTFGTGL